VLGPEDGIAMAQQEGLDVLLISRTDDGFEMAGTGTLSGYASQFDDEANIPPVAANANGTLATLAITFVAFAVLLFLMAIGVMFGRRSISGSCGGLANTKNEDGSISCSLCSNPDNACRELRSRMNQGSEVET